MNNKLFVLLCFYCSGILLARTIGDNEISLFILIFLIVVMGVTIFLYIIKKPLNLVVMVLFFLIGALQYNQFYLGEGIEDKYANEEVFIEATVLEVDQYKDRINIIFQADSLVYQDHKIERKFKGDCVIFTSENFQVSQGDIVHIRGIVIAQPILMDRDLYDSRLIQREKAIEISLKTNQERLEVVGKKSVSLYYTLKTIITSTVKKSMSKLFKGRVYQFALATLLGLKDELIDIDKEIFDKSGVSHILVVSGLHVAMVTSWIGYVSYKLIKNRWLNILTLSVFLLLYCVVTGFSPSTLRASILIFFYLLGKTLGTRYNTLSALSFAALIMLIINPLTLFLPSFQLSFGAVLGIYFLNQRIQDKLTRVYKPLASIISITVSVQLFTLPIALYHFNTIPVMSLLANVLILPLFSFAMILLMASLIISMITLDGGYFFVKLYNIVVGLIIYITTSIGNISFSQINFISPHPFAILVYYLTLLAALKGGKRKIIIFAGVTVISIVLVIQIYNPFLFKAYFIDVGQGDCALIRLTGGTNILIDTGQQKHALRTIIPYARKKGVNKIDYLIISHDHDDHSGGAVDIIKNMGVGKIVMAKNNFTHQEYLTLVSLIESHNKSILYLEGGDAIDFGSGDMEVVHPRRDFINYNTDSNEGSLVSKINYKDISVLFTGDIGFSAEEEITKNGKNIRSDVLKVSHHGSNYSSSLEFLDEISPKVSIIQVGSNRYGHPGEQALNRIKQSKGTILNTLENGTISIISNGKKIWIKTGYN